MLNNPNDNPIVYPTNKIVQKDKGFFGGMSDNESGEEGEKIQVKFVTKIDDPKYQPPDTAFYIPISLARYGLSEIVNHILELGKQLQSPLRSSIYINI